MRKLLRFIHGHVTHNLPRCCAPLYVGTLRPRLCVFQLLLLQMLYNRCLGILHRSLPEFVSQTLVEFLQTLDNR